MVFPTSCPGRRLPLSLSSAILRAHLLPSNLLHGPRWLLQLQPSHLLHQQKDEWKEHKKRCPSYLSSFISEPSAQVLPAGLQTHIKAAGDAGKRPTSNWEQRTAKRNQALLRRKRVGRMAVGRQQPLAYPKCRSDFKSS